MGRLPRSGSVQVTTTASPDQVWPLLADITRAGEWSHENRGGDWLDGATSAVPGARFRGRNANGRARWTRVCEILTADQPREIAWRTVPKSVYRDSTIWTYGLEQVDGGTRITQRFEVVKLGPVSDRLFYAAIPAHRDRTEALLGDLRKLAEAAERSTSVEAV